MTVNFRSNIRKLNRSKGKWIHSDCYQCVCISSELFAGWIQLTELPVGLQTNNTQAYTTSLSLASFRSSVGNLLNVPLPKLTSDSRVFSGGCFNSLELSVLEYSVYIAALSTVRQHCAFNDLKWRAAAPLLRLFEWLLSDIKVKLLLRHFALFREWFAFVDFNTTSCIRWEGSIFGLWQCNQLWNLHAIEVQ